MSAGISGFPKVRWLALMISRALLFVILAMLYPAASTPDFIPSGPMTTLITDPCLMAASHWS